MKQEPKLKVTKQQLKLNRVLTVGLMAAACVIVCFPLLLRARMKLANHPCAANLAQIGKAIALYSADNNERFPAVVDASDKSLHLWDAQPVQAALIKKLPLLQVPLKAYAKSPSIFHCPLDNGGFVMDNTFGGGTRRFYTAPTMYQNYGSSYLYRTEITFKSLHQKGYWPPANVAMLFDGYGHWHGHVEPITQEMNFRHAAELIREYRYNVLFGDGHVETLNFNELQMTWNQKL